MHFPVTQEPELVFNRHNVLRLGSIVKLIGTFQFSFFFILFHDIGS